MSISTLILRPTADDYKSNIGFSTGSAAWSLIDEATEDTADYVYAMSTNSGIVTVALANPARSGIPVWVKIHAKAKVTSGSGQIQCQIEWAAGGTPFPITILYAGVLSTTDTEYVWTMRCRHNPTGNMTALTWDDIDGLCAGVLINSTVASASRLYQLWVEIGYMDEATATVTIYPTGDSTITAMTLTPTGGTAASKVDEATLDTADYLKANNYPAAALLTWPAQISLGVLKYLEVCVVFKGFTASTPYAAVRINGVDVATQLAMESASGSIRTWNQIVEADPATGNAFTWEQIPSMIAGVYETVAAGMVIYQVNIKCHYQPAFTTVVNILPAGVGHVAGSCVLAAGASAVTALRFEVDMDPAFGSLDADTGDLTEAHVAGETVTKIVTFTPTVQGILYGRMGFKAAGDAAYTWYTTNAIVRFPSLGTMTISNQGEQFLFTLLVNDQYDQPPTVTLSIDGRAYPMTVQGKAAGAFTYTLTAPLERGVHRYDVQVDNIWQTVRVINLSFAADYRVTANRADIFVGQRKINAWGVGISTPALPDVATISFDCATYEPGNVDVRLYAGGAVKFFTFKPYRITLNNGVWHWEGKDSYYDALTEVTTELVVGQPSSELVEKVAMPALCANPEIFTESITAMAWENVPRLDIIRQLLLCNGLTGAVRNGVLTAYPIDVGSRVGILGVSKNEPLVQYAEDPRTWNWLRVWYTLAQMPNPADALTNGGSELWTGTVSDVRETNNGILSASGAYGILKGTGVISVPLAARLSAYDRLKLNWCPATGSTVTVKLIQDASNFLTYTRTYGGQKADGFILTSGASSDSVLKYTIPCQKKVAGVTGRATQPCRVRILLKDSGGNVLQDSDWITSGTDNWWGYSWGPDFYENTWTFSVELQFSSLYVITSSYGVSIPELRITEYTTVGSYTGNGGYVADRKSYNASITPTNWTKVGDYQYGNINIPLGPAPAGGGVLNIYDASGKATGWVFQGGLQVNKDIPSGYTIQNINGQLVAVGQVKVWAGVGIPPEGALLQYQGATVSFSAASIISEPVVHYIYGLKDWAWGGGMINGWDALDLDLAQFVKTGSPDTLATVELTVTGDAYYDTLALYASKPQRFYVDVKSGSGLHFREFPVEGFGSEASARLYGLGMLKLLSAPRTTYTVQRPMSTPVALGDVVNCDGTPLAVYQVTYDVDNATVTFCCGQRMEDLQELLKSTGRRMEALERNLS